MFGESTGDLGIIQPANAIALVCGGQIKCATSESSEIMAGNHRISPGDVRPCQIIKTQSPQADHVSVTDNSAKGWPRDVAYIFVPAKFEIVSTHDPTVGAIGTGSGCVLCTPA